MPGKVERKKESQKARKPEREIDRDEYISNRRRKRVNFRHVKRVDFRRAKRGPDHLNQPGVALSLNVCW